MGHYPIGSCSRALSKTARRLLLPPSCSGTGRWWLETRKSLGFRKTGNACRRGSTKTKTKLYLRSHYAGAESSRRRRLHGAPGRCRRWLVAEDDVPGGRPVGATAPVVAPRSPWVVLYAVLGAAWCAYDWATAAPAKPL